MRRRAWSALAFDGNLEIKNRIVLLSMQLGYAEEERARGGAGLLIVGGARKLKSCQQAVLEAAILARQI